SRRRHTRSKRDWSSDVCSSDLADIALIIPESLDHADEREQHDSLLVVQIQLFQSLIVEVNIDDIVQCGRFNVAMQLGSKRMAKEIGRASCRERIMRSVVAVMYI